MEVPEQVAAAAIPEGGAARALGTPAAAPGSSHSSEPVCAGPPGSLVPCVSAHAWWAT